MPDQFKIYSLGPDLAWTTFGKKGQLNKW